MPFSSRRSSGGGSRSSARLSYDLGRYRRQIAVADTRQRLWVEDSDTGTPAPAGEDYAAGFQNPVVGGSTGSRMFESEGASSSAAAGAGGNSNAAPRAASIMFDAEDAPVALPTFEEEHGSPTSPTFGGATPRTPIRLVTLRLLASVFGAALAHLRFTFSTNERAAAAWLPPL